MARQSGVKVSTIYSIAERFRDNCLLNEGSLLFAEETIWTEENIRELQKNFVENSDARNLRFEEKLKVQLSACSDDALKLMAEMLCVYFLFPSNVTGARKIQLVAEVLSWRETELPQDIELQTGFESGLGNAGQGYNTRRPIELEYIIQFAHAWRAAENKHDLLSDPWVFMQFVDGIETRQKSQFRHILLHLLFPDTFESTASAPQKLRIVETFSELDGGLAGKCIDRRLFAIRETLTELLPGQQEFSFYRTPVAEAWHDETAGIAEHIPFQAMLHKKQLMMFGPPGTGKTYGAKKLAEQIIRNAAIKKWGAARFFSSQDELDKLVDKQVKRLQLHPAYGYEEFIRALHLTPEGGTQYKIGYLPRLIEEIESERDDDQLPYVLILDEINRTNLSQMLGECFSLLEDRDQTLTLPGFDEHDRLLKLKIPSDLFVIGTMNLIDQSVEQIDFALRRRFLWLECPFDSNALRTGLVIKWEATGSAKNENIGPAFDAYCSAATALNIAIEQNKLLGKEYQIGHTYFYDIVPFLDSRLKLSSTTKHLLWNKDGKPTEPLEQLWDLSIEPLIQQYLWGVDSESQKQTIKHLKMTFLIGKSGN